MRFYVGNIPLETTEETLIGIFVDKGYVVDSLNIMTDRDTNKSRGFAFVELVNVDEHDTKYVLAHLKGIKILNRILSIDKARPIEKKSKS